MTPSVLLDGVLHGEPAGQRRAMAKAITLLESTRADHRALGDELLTALLPHTGKAFRLGLSGVPGVGKSTFIEALGLYLIGKGHRVAVLTVDPSSTVSGGSILGDKTRMEKLSVHEQAYIRPSPSSGTLGGVAEKTREAMLVCEAAGYDVVIAVEDMDEVRTAGSSGAAPRAALVNLGWIAAEGGRDALPVPAIPSRLRVQGIFRTDVTGLLLGANVEDHGGWPMRVQQADPAQLRTYQEKRDLVGQVGYCIKRFDDPLISRQVAEYTRRMADVFCPFDYGRFEFRVDQATGDVHLLEVNLNCNLWSQKVFGRAAALAGWSHPELIETLKSRGARPVAGTPQDFAQHIVDRPADQVAAHAGDDAEGTAVVAPFADLQIRIVTGRELDARHATRLWHQVQEGVVRLGHMQVHRVHHFLRGMRAGDGQHAGMHLAHQVAAALAFAGTQTSGDDDLAILGQRLADGVQAFPHRVVDEATGVDDHQIGTGEGLGGLVTLGAELREDEFGIGQRLGAAQADKADLGRCGAGCQGGVAHGPNCLRPL